MKKKIFKGFMLLVILFGIFQFYASHFYSEEKLKVIGVKKIETYYQLANDTLTNEERVDVAKSSLSKNQMFAILELDRYPQLELNQIEVVDVQRNYYEYDMLVEIEEGIHGESQKNSYRFSFSRGMLGFKINGIHRFS